jgi:hypothetical protein
LNNQTKNNKQSQSKQKNIPKQYNQKPAATKKKTTSQQKSVPQQKQAPKQQPESKKETASIQKIQQQLQSEKANNSGMRFEITVANHFQSLGWTPRLRVEMLGYEYDLFAEYKSGWQTKYLVVECKNSGLVSAKDIVHFLVKVMKLAEKLLQASYSKPELYAYLCHTGDVDEEAATVAKSHNPSVEMIKFG